MLEEATSYLTSKLRRRLGGNLTGLILFGSALKMARAPQDVDILLLLSKSDPDVEIRSLEVELIEELLLHVRVRFSFTTMTRSEFDSELEAGSTFLASLLTGYQIIYDADGSISRSMDALRRRSRLAPITYIERGRRWRLGSGI